MKIIITMLLVCASIISCTNANSDKNQKELKSVTLMPPANNKKSEYIIIDTNLLASSIDLVCEMSIRNRVIDTISYEGKLYAFCGVGCKEAFSKEPHSFLTQKGGSNSHNH